nr:MAG: hypothetical protein DIU58_08925 [Sphaerobacter thermophilus]
MVGRLVQYQHVRLSEQQERDTEPGLLAAAQAGDRTLVVHRTQPEPVQNGRRTLFPVVAAECFEASQGRVVRFERAVARVLRQSRPGLRQRTLGLHPLALRRGDRVRDGPRFRLSQRLRQVADLSVPRRADNLAPVRSLLADDAAEQRRLPGTIRADQTHPLARVHHERDIVENDL